MEAANFVLTSYSFSDFHCQVKHFVRSCVSVTLKSVSNAVEWNGSRRSLIDLLV